MPIERKSEFVTINGDEETKYEAYIDSPIIGEMKLEMNGDHASLRNTFKDINSMNVYPNNDEGTEPWGIYPNVKFVISSESEDNIVIITIHVLTDEEVEMRELKAMVNDHEEILSEMMFGGVE